MGVSYRQAKQFLGQPVIAYDRDGKSYAGIVQKVSHDTVWFTPLPNQINPSSKSKKKKHAEVIPAVSDGNTDIEEARFPFGGGGINPFGMLGGFSPFGGGGGFNPMGKMFGAGGFNPFGGGSGFGGFNPFGGGSGFGGTNPFGGGSGFGGFNPFGGGSGGSNPLGMLFGGSGGSGGFPIPLNLLMNMASRFMW